MVVLIMLDFYSPHAYKYMSIINTAADFQLILKTALELLLHGALHLLSMCIPFALYFFSKFVVYMDLSENFSCSPFISLSFHHPMNFMLYYS